MFTKLCNVHNLLEFNVSGSKQLLFDHTKVIFEINKDRTVWLKFKLIRLGVNCFCVTKERLNLLGLFKDKLHDSQTILLVYKRCKKVNKQTTNNLVA